MEEIPGGYGLPIKVGTGMGKISGQAVMVLDMLIVPVNDGAGGEPIRAVVVFTPEDATTVANDIKAVLAGEEQ